MRQVLFLSLYRCELDRDNLFAQLAYERRIIGRAQWGRARQLQRDENISMRAALLKMEAIIEEDATLLDDRLPNINPAETK